MQFILLSSDHLDAFRRFAFQSIGEDRSRSTVVVSVDLTLAGKYAIQVQELPLLCRQFLEAADPDTTPASFVALTEAHISAAAKAKREAIEKVKSRRTSAARQRNGPSHGEHAI